MDKQQQNLISQWALTVLLELRGWKALEGKSNGSFTSDRDILAAVGLEHLEDEKMNKKQFLVCVWVCMGTLLTNWNNTCLAELD